MNGPTPVMQDLPRIKANVGSMIDQGATKQEIDAYLASEGVTAQDLRGRMSPQDEQAYAALAADPKSTAADIQGFARQRGFDVTDADAMAFIAARSRNPRVGGGVQYRGTPGAPSPSPAAADSSPLASISATAGEVMDGLIPGSGKALSGAGGALGNSVAAGLGWADWHPGQAYEEEANAHEQDQAQLEADHPNIATAANWTGVAGSFALPAARVARGAGLGAGIANGAVTGTGYGALSGFLNDTGEGRLANAAIGAGFGGVLGGAAAPIAGKVASTLSTARRNVPGVDATARFLANVPRHALRQPLIPANASAHAQAERMLARSMDGTTIEPTTGVGTVPAAPDTITAEVARRASLGTPAMPADINDDLRQTVAWALQGRGTMASRAREALAARQAYAGPRVRGHITEELGSTVDPIAEVEAIRRRASAAAQPGYEAASAQPVMVTPEIESIMQTPAFQEALPQAVRNIRNAGRDPYALGFQVGPDGNLSGMDTLSTEGFDQVIRAMRDSGRAAGEVNPITGRVRQTTNSVHINDRARDLQAALAEQNAPYREVTANYADEMALQDALRRGGDVGKLSGPEIDAQRRAMPEAAREGWMTGARSTLADAATQASLKPAANVAQAVRQPLGMSSGAGALASAGDQAKLRAIEAMADKPGVLQGLGDRLGSEDAAWRTYAAAFAPKRPTGPLDDVMGHMGTAVDVTRKLASGRPIAALSSVLLKGNPRGTLAYRQAVQDRTAEVLTAHTPESVRAGMGALSSRVLSDQAKRGALYRGAGNLAKVGALQAAGLDTDPMPLDDPDDQAVQEYPANADQAPIYRRR